MSGHSHWSSIKHKKGRADEKRSKIFSKMSKIITVVAKDGGDPNLNSKLALSIEKAKSFNMPTDNIERAIKKGSGDAGVERLEELVYEGYGPAGIAVIIETITDNKNRTVNELKHIFAQFNAKFAETGAVRWMFERKGVIIMSLGQEIFKEIADGEKKEKMELMVIEAGAEDISWDNNKIDIYVNADDIKAIKENLEAKGLVVDEASLDWVPENYQEVNPADKEKIEKFFEALYENDDVQEIYSNSK